MANIRVTCPECKSELELDATFEGQEVECGNCLKVFKATRPGSGGSSAPGTKKIPGAGTKPAAGSGGGSRPAGRPAPKKRRGDESDDDYGSGRRRRRRDEDDDDYEHDRRREDDYDDDDYGPPPYRAAGEGDGPATASMVMGIVSLVIVCCWPLSLPLAIAAIVTGVVGQKSQTNKGQATAGLVLGVITLCVFGALIVVGLGDALFNRNRFN